MKYIKHFDAYSSIPGLTGMDRYLNGKDSFFISDVMTYLGVEIEYPEDSIVIAKSIYDINVIEFFKEIFVDKVIIAKSLNKLKNDPTIRGEVRDVDQFAYQDEFFITVKRDNDDDFIILDDNSLIFVYEYDADNKPLHKEVKMKKLAEKYNL